MSSIDALDIVLRVKGMPASRAARASSTSARWHSMPLKPVGATASGIRAGAPRIRVSSERCEASTSVSGTKRQRAKTCRFQSRVAWSSAPLSR